MASRLAWWASLLLITLPVCGQEAVRLPVVNTPAEAAVQGFRFVSDGPVGPGWSRPDEIARVYLHDELPPLFLRTIVLDTAVPMHGKLAWIFTGPHAGFTVELTGSKVRLMQRFYDSTALQGPAGNYPQRVVKDEEQQFTGQARTLTVMLDAHLAVEVLVNGVVLLKQACAFDVLRDQLMFSAPRTEHLVLSGALLGQRAQAAVSVRVDPAKRFQTMIGFGGSPSIPAYQEMSDEGKRRYWAMLRRYNLLIDREYPASSELRQDLSNFDNAADATPHYYGDNFPNGEVSDFSYSRRAVEMGGEVIYEVWALPPWAVEPYTGARVIDAWNKPVRIAAKPEEYARIVVGYAKAAKERTGPAPAVIGMQNEVEEPAEVAAKMVLAVRQALDAAGFQATKIHMADASFMYMGTERITALRKDAAAWKDIDFTAVHEYDFQEFMANPDLYDERLRAFHEAAAGKPFLATEICLNDPAYQEPSYRVALNVGQLYQKNLTELDAEALMYCWLLLDTEQPTFMGSRALLELDKSDGNMPVATSFQLRVLGAFSRHVLKGMTRVESVSGDKDLLTVAFTDGTRDSVIVLNRSTESRRLNVAWSGVRWSEMERTDQRSENATTARVPAELTVAPGQIVVLANFSAEAAQTAVKE